MVDQLTRRFGWFHIVVPFWDLYEQWNLDESICSQKKWFPDFSGCNNYHEYIVSFVWHDSLDLLLLLCLWLYWLPDLFPSNLGAADQCRRADQCFILKKWVLERPWPDAEQNSCAILKMGCDMCGLEELTTYSIDFHSMSKPQWICMDLEIPSCSKFIVDLCFRSTMVPWKRCAFLHN